MRRTGQHMRLNDGSLDQCDARSAPHTHCLARPPCKAPTIWYTALHGAIDARYNELMDQAMLDCYGEEEVLRRLLHVRRSVALPLQATLIGVPSSCTGWTASADVPAASSPSSARRAALPVSPTWHSSPGRRRRRMARSLPALGSDLMGIPFGTSHAAWGDAGAQQITQKNPASSWCCLCEALHLRLCVESGNFQTASSGDGAAEAALQTNRSVAPEHPWIPKRSSAPATTKSRTPTR